MIETDFAAVQHLLSPGRMAYARMVAERRPVWDAGPAAAILRFNEVTRALARGAPILYVDVLEAEVVGWLDERYPMLLTPPRRYPPWRRRS